MTLTAICGSDLHLYDGYIPTMKNGDILGHEFMGEVVAVGTTSAHCNIGDRVVIPFTIACGQCFFCQPTAMVAVRQYQSERGDARKALSDSTAGLFGYSHLSGGYAGGQAEYLRVPFADVGALQIPAGIPGRTGAVPVGYLSDGLHGGGELRHPGRATSWPSGAAARWASSPSRAPSWERNESSPSIVSRNGSHGSGAWTG